MPENEMTEHPAATEPCRCGHRYDSHGVLAHEGGRTGCRVCGCRSFVASEHPAASPAPLSAEPIDDRSLPEGGPWFGCFTGDCPHETKAECDAAIRAEFAKLEQENAALHKAAQVSAEPPTTWKPDESGMTVQEWIARHVAALTADRDRLARELADARLTATYESDMARQAVDSRDRLARRVEALEVRWATFRQAVLATDAMLQRIARVLVEMDEPETADALRAVALQMFVSVQDEAIQTGPAAITHSGAPA